MQRFTDLRVWQRAHALVLAVYRLSAGFPADERFGLIAQVRRAAVSVPANIAEGSKRVAPGDYQRFLNISESSLAETQYLLILCRDLGYGTGAAVGEMLGESEIVAGMLHHLRTRVRPR